MNIFEHLAELRTRLIYIVLFFFATFASAYFFAEDIYNFLVQPLAEVAGDRQMIFTGLAEGFFTHVKLALFAAFLVSFPVIATQGYIFLAPGLYKTEKKFIIPFLAAAPILFSLGAALVYYFIMPLAWKFFLGFESSGQGGLPIRMEARISEYLALVMHLIIGFGLAFQLPIILVLLAKIGVITPEFLKSKRKIAVVIILIGAAVLTPPDIISQIALAVILYGLYELSIIGSKLVRK